MFGEILPNGMVDIRRTSREECFDPLREVNVLAQIRPHRNPRYEDLARSVTRGILNSVDAAVVEKPTIQEYREFTYDTWGRPEKPPRLKPIYSASQYAGLYLLLIAGESRYLAVRQVRQESGIPYALPCKLHDVTSVDDIVGIQADENIHSNPPQERTAQAYAEAYLWRKAKEPGLTKTAFRESQGVTRDALDNALAYASLPGWVRQSITRDEVPFTVAVEIAKAHATLLIIRSLELAGKKDPENLTAEESAMVSKALKVDMSHALANYLTKSKRKTLRALQIIRSERKMYTVKLEDLLHDNGIRYRRDMRLVSVDFPQLDLERRRQETRQMLRDFRSQSGHGAWGLCNSLARIVGEPMEGPQQQQARDVIDLAQRILQVGVN